ncbi:PEP-CTERM sorting domain-containing protein [Desulfopila sp. IMCC35006]|uniref:PEP-CTERM sorting domain-containing protein n=1 Tax=Desulfopila sp. IMCC35006 TaxID=2569542 RepID=UPI0010ABCEAA|nr:PEP-CTERM sorting domain-containing protein [Desulfopila sp. IMCC35006]TKB25968.1 PEP-CTERM sorting domain-containing protein [Desulfopila sp. IMCC35006]
MNTTLRIVMFALAGLGISAGNASGLSMAAPNYAKDVDAHGGAGKAPASRYAKAIQGYAPQTTAVDQIDKKNTETMAQEDPADQSPDLQINEIATYPENYDHGERAGGKNLHTVDGAGEQLDLTALGSNIYFYLIDPAEAGSITTIYANDLSNTLFSNLPNGSKWFIGISMDGNEGNFPPLVWTTTKEEDGWRAGLVSTVFPIPEPATLILLATGIAGLAGISSRKRKV